MLKKINRAAFKYSDYISACDKIAREAQKHIDWSDRVSCEYYPADGICVEIEEHVCHAFTFFELVEEAKDGMISETLYIRNCI
ncbi:hypothetical protein F2Z84_11360 [Bacteroides fragilis]|uniref:Uncharacterized protein n=1 Tax=Bacteroides fragilis TaxID=817 RepID=A0A5M5XGD3_BACFG|nr:hypothetical protein F2Z30_12485 [Bacteroides fragilis]KAA5193823.1 hypothetical protein F2Z50_11810 [Bacteroides fragilis]KAA5199112.1 hypothetical protein F2Z24_13595 [Bacteroides fragilis]KAA5201632.1 hypothetical protein F2Z84_11360 [Bacteroides fragilis]KAA5205516.1 hypothetical protein F2Z25_18670 [Bacteroides fragilis]